MELAHLVLLLASIATPAKAGSDVAIQTPAPAISSANGAGQSLAIDAPASARASETGAIASPIDQNDAASASEAGENAEQDEQAPDPGANVEPSDESGGEILVTGEFEPEEGDPAEKINIQTFRAAQEVDSALVEPVARAYDKALPKPAHAGLRNVIFNLGEPISFANSLLQLKPKRALRALGRFVINTTLGIGGLFDVAGKKPFNIPHQFNGFANTLGRYGVGSGPYMFLPIIGPTSLRDLVGRIADLSVVPSLVGSPFNDPYYAIPAGTLRALESRLEIDEALKTMRDDCVDFYAANRDVYLARRQREIDQLRHRHSARLDLYIERIKDNCDITDETLRALGLEAALFVPPASQSDATVEGAQASEGTPADGGLDLLAGGRDAQGRMIAPVLAREDAIDTQSFAHPLDARVVHVDLDLDLDFDRRAVSGRAALDVLARGGVGEVVLDSDGLEIAAITDGKGHPLAYQLGERVEGKGAPLTIRFAPEERTAIHRILIDYAARNAPALQWLSPEQTVGKAHPYLFSQGQATLNRTWIPTQDSPGIRQTWSARITAPAPLTVVMSGLSQGAPQDLGDGRRAFRFEMDRPVAPYLIAIAAGDILFKPLGPRSGVWSEPAMIEAAAKELEDTEAMIAAAEALYGPYRWGRYDMIVLPPSFPYGGMENPVMTFLTPTFIAGDKSLTGLVAHELAHSWSGNLVTNAVWGDGWLNEGVTSYFENRIVEQIYGKSRAEQEAALSFANIERVLAEVGEDAPGTALHNDGEGELVGSAIAYDKGAFFLRTLEHLVGRERFDRWLRLWFDSHAFQPATSAMILAHMEQHLAKDQAEARALMLREWIFDPGLPANVYRPDPQAFAEVDKAVERFTNARVLDEQAWQRWSSAERQRFLANLPDRLDPYWLALLDERLALTQNRNNEELFLWLRLAAANGYQPIEPKIEEFLTRVGRAKFVRPLFSALVDQGAWGRALAERIYARTRPLYHSVTQRAVDRVMAQAE